MKGLVDALNMPNFASTAAFADLETTLFAADATLADSRSIAYAANRPPRSPRPGSLKPLPFLPRPPEWRRLASGVGCEAILIRARQAASSTTIPQAA